MENYNGNNTLIIASFLHYVYHQTELRPLNDRMRELLINYNHTEDNWHIITQKPTSELPDFDEDLLKKPTKEENMNDMIKITRKQGL